jgi:hypothetical protein
MPRYRRQTPEGSVQHVISRFVDRERRLEALEARAEYLDRAGRVLDRSDWRALGYALMGSHVHWAMRAGRASSAAFIKPLHVGFAGWLNAREHRLGPVFADRHRTLTFEADTALALLAYIHNNPVRAGLVGDPSDSSWTSHRAYLGLVPPPPWLDVERGLALCGFSCSRSGRLAFHEAVLARAHEARRVDLSGGDMHERRRSMRAVMRAPIEIATPVVKMKAGALHVELASGRSRIAASAGAMRAAPWRGDPATVLELVERKTGVDLRPLHSFKRPRPVSHARRLALLVWTCELHRPTVEIARYLGVSSSSAAQLIRTASAGTRELAASLGERAWADGKARKTKFPRTVP